jgi:D-alanyl-D-alanine carboxypeptidase/D-alanyl-D-alanine-endopeptidase (penicillin-binding protein 4)
VSRRFRAFVAGAVAAFVGAAGVASGAPSDGAAPQPLEPRSLASKLRKISAQAGSGTGVWVSDPSGGGQVIFGDDSGERRILASNTKLFTTATALDRLGPETNLVTRVFAETPPAVDGTVEGSLYIVGDGDPTFGDEDVAALADEIKKAGVRRVTGKILVDDTVFDRRRGLGKNPNTPNSYVGPLSGLSFEFGQVGPGFSAKPEIDAGVGLRSALERRDVGVAGDVDYGTLPDALAATEPVAELASPTVAELVESTNEPSDNFFAEMLLKRLAVTPTRQGTTQAGTIEVRAYARSLGTRVRAKDGSGIGRKNKASAEQVGKLLAAMLEEPAADEFHESLPRAGMEGTLSHRMNNTAAEGRCRAKTGTISGVSALSGYCDLAAGPIVFSILMNGIGSNYTGARNLQDRMVVAIARYGG